MSDATREILQAAYVICAVDLICADCTRRFGGHLASMTVRRGSLLAALDVISGGALSKKACDGYSFTKVSPAQWLNWLQLPWPKDGGEGVTVQASTAAPTLPRHQP